jgi:hypothetical protein
MDHPPWSVFVADTAVGRGEASVSIAFA